MARLKIEWSTDAKADLFDILDFYIRRNQSATYSKKLNADIRASIKLIARYPSLDLKTDYDFIRVLITKDYQVIYEIFDRVVLIIMIWDCRNDPEDKRIGRRLK